MSAQFGFKTSEDSEDVVEMIEIGAVVLK